MSIAYRFIEPLDVLSLRGNKLFGASGSLGESLVLPWPSAVAGALRSMMLAADGVDVVAFSRGATRHPTLGTPAEPGSFELVALDLARRGPTGEIETLHALPADLIVTGDRDKGFKIDRLRPVAPAAGLASSAPLALWPVRVEARRGKAVGGHWLTQAAWGEYLAGGVPSDSQLVQADVLWKVDTRVGVGLDSATGSAEDGKLFTVEQIAFSRGVGFLAAIRGAEPPTSGVLRLGGDGRGAALHAVEYARPCADFDAIARARRCRVVLTTPGIFRDGWLLPGVDDDRRIALHDIKGRLTCAAVPRAEVVSGWDLALRQPKDALRAAPAGSVYWIDDLDATPEQLGKLAERGLWASPSDNASRKAEGFSRFAFASC